MTCLSKSQKQGVTFVKSVFKKYRAAYLADVPGFGKTRQALAIMNEIAANGEVLYVCPKSVIPQTRDNLEPFKGKLTLVGYTDLRGFETFDLARKLQKEYDLVILDEAHNIKNTLQGGGHIEISERTLDTFDQMRQKKIRKSGMIAKIVAQSAGTIYATQKAKKFLFLSGTPLTKSLQDLFIFFRIAKHPFGYMSANVYDSYYAYCRHFMNTYMGTYGIEFSGINQWNAEKFEKGVAEVVLRRLHEDETEEKLKVPEPERIKIEISAPELAKSEKMILDLFKKKGKILEPKTIEKLLSIVPGFEDFATFRQAMGYTKVQPLYDFLKKKEWKKFIVFCYHKSIAKEVSQTLGGLLITGGMPLHVRAKRVSEENQKKESIIVATYGALGTGFDLNKFDKLLRIEYDWSLAMFDQSEGRVLRKGSGLKSTIVDFFTKNGLENYILKNLKQKNKGMELLRKK